MIRVATVLAFLALLTAAVPLLSSGRSAGGGVATDSAERIQFAKSDWRVTG